jgi:hypothetical protein
MATVPARSAGWAPILGPLGGVAFGVLLIALSFGIRDEGSTIYGPRFWPQLIGALLVAINGVVVVRSFLRGIVIDEGVSAARPAKVAGRDGGRVSHWVAAALVLALPLIVQMFGFLCGSAVFLIAFMRALGYRRWAVISLTAVAFALCITWFFTAAVYTPLPAGKGPFYKVSAEFSRLIAR